MGHGFFATLLAVDQMGCADGIVGAAAIPAAFAQFTLGMRSHVRFSL